MPSLSSPSLTVRIVAAAIAAVLLYVSSHRFSREPGSPNGALLSGGGGDQPSADYVAGPNPLRAVGPKPDERWRVLVETMTAEVQAGDKGEGFELVFYGDSITETWRGTDLGKPCKRGGCKEAPAIFQRHFGDLWRTGIFGVAADQTGHLLWRLRNGHTPAATHAPKAAVILIGTNDLGHAAEAGAAEPSSFAPNALVRIRAIVEHLRAVLPSTKLVVLGVLPRGWRGPSHFGVRPEKDFWYDWPNAFTQGIEEINAGLKALAKADKQVLFLDCSKPFVSGGKVLDSLMPDALHPNGPGMEEWAKCMDPILKGMLGTPSKGAAAAA